MKIEPKHKKCKGTNKAKGHGCGKSVLERKYGLGKYCCYNNWLLNTKEGQETLTKHQIRASKKVKHENDKKTRQDIKRRKIVAYSGKYKNLLQDEINLLARKIDTYFGFLCIDCGKYYGKQADGSHFHNVGGNENIRYNLHNIHKSKSDCNQYHGGNKEGYKDGLVHRYGVEYFEYVKYKMGIKYKYIGLSEVEIYEKLTIVRKINREFDNYQLLDAISARDLFNTMIGIYK